MTGASIAGTGAQTSVPGVEMIADQAAAGTDQLEACFRSEYAALVGLAGYLGDRTVAEEVVQDAFVAVFGRLHRVRADRLVPYLRRAVVNGARSSLRRRQVRDRPLATSAATTSPSAEATAVARDGDGALLERLAGLPSRQREVLVLRYYLDLSEQQIADTLGIAPGSVKTHASRGLAALAIDLAEEER